MNSRKTNKLSTRVVGRLSALALLACPTAVAAFSGSVLSQSPTAFIGGQQSGVSVRVQNSGDACKLAVKSVNVPAGRSVNSGNPLASDYIVVPGGQVPRNEKRDVGTFNVTPPVSGAHATLTWELWRGHYLFIVWVFDEKLSTRQIPVSATPPDRTPPTISGVSATVDSEARVTVRATVTDAGTGVRKVQCSYQGPGDLLRESFTMTHQGGGVYEGRSKAYNESGTFKYAVEAWGNRNNYRRDPSSGDRNVPVSVDRAGPAVSSWRVSNDGYGHVTVTVAITDVRGVDDDSVARGRWAG